MKKIITTLSIILLLIINLFGQRNTIINKLNIKGFENKTHLPLMKSNRINSLNIIGIEGNKIRNNVSLSSTKNNKTNHSFKNLKTYTPSLGNKEKNSFSKVKTNKRLKRKTQSNRATNDTILYASFPYYISNGIVDVNNIDVDGLILKDTTIASAWLTFYDTINSITGDTNFYIASTSYFSSPGIADDWIIFDSLLIPNNGAKLSWKHYYDDNNYRDGYQVLISKALSPSYDTILHLLDNDIKTFQDTLWTDQMLNIDSNKYGGSYVSIAFRNIANDMYWINIDDILLTEAYDSLTASSNYDLKAFGIMKPDTNSFLANVTNDTLKLIISNNGDSIASSDSIDLTLTLNSITYGSSAYDYKVYNHNLDTGYIIILSIYNFTTQDMQPGENLDVCFNIDFPGDNNSLNDSYCHTFTVKPKVPSTCDTIIYQDFSSMSINEYYTDTNYSNSYLYKDIDSIEHHWSILDSTYGFPNAIVDSTDSSGYLIDSLYNGNDYYMMFNSYLSNSIDTAKDYYGFVIDIPSNGAIFSWEHAYLNNLYRNAYSIIILEYGNSSNYEILESFSDNDPKTDGHLSWQNNAVYIDSNTWGSKSAYVYILHRSHDQYLVLFDNLLIRGNCPGSNLTCNSYSYISAAYDTACVSYEKLTYPNGNIADSVYVTIDSSGTYIDTVNVLGACTIQEVHITIYPKPDSLIITGQTNTGINNVEYYSVTQNTGSSYTWTITGGNIISGQSTNSIQVQWSAMGNGEITVYETSGYGCIGDTIKVNVQVSPPVGINDKDMPGFAIIPNPVLNKATIHLTNNSLGCSLSIYDLLGNKIKMHEYIFESRIEIDASEFSKGVYFIVLNKGEHSVKQKILFK